MGGIVGRLFREFAMTLSVAILVSLVDLADDDADDVRLSCCEAGHDKPTGRLYRIGERVFDAVLSVYDRSLGWALRIAGARHADPGGHDRASTSISISSCPRVSSRSRIPGG